MVIETSPVQGTSHQNNARVSNSPAWPKNEWEQAKSEKATAARESHLYLAVFVSEQDTRENTALFAAIDAFVSPHATMEHLTWWYPYEVSTPHLCLEHLPTAYITAQGVWHERDPQQEQPADALTLERQRMYEFLLAEEKQRDPTTDYERSLVRMTIWETEHPFPLTPWRLQWRQCLLDHAAQQVVYVLCDQDEPNKKGTP